MQRALLDRYRYAEGTGLSWRLIAADMQAITDSDISAETIRRFAKDSILLLASRDRKYDDVIYSYLTDPAINALQKVEKGPEEQRLSAALALAKYLSPRLGSIETPFPESFCGVFAQQSRLQDKLSHKIIRSEILKREAIFAHTQYISIDFDVDGSILKQETYEGFSVIDASGILYIFLNSNGGQNTLFLMVEFDHETNDIVKNLGILVVYAAKLSSVILAARINTMSREASEQHIKSLQGRHGAKQISVYEKKDSNYIENEIKLDYSGRDYIKNNTLKFSGAKSINNSNSSKGTVESISHILEVWRADERSFIPEAVRYIERGGDINAVDPVTGYTLLHLSAQTNCRKLIRMLRDTGECDFLIRDSRQRLSSELALSTGLDAPLGHYLMLKEKQQAEANGLPPPLMRPPRDPIAPSEP